MFQLQYYFYYYSIVSGIALIVHLIINWRQLVDWRNVRSRAEAREFRVFLACLTFFFVLDIMWGILAEMKCRSLLYADTVLFFMTMALALCAWTRFVVAYLGMEGRSRRCLLWTGRGLLAFFLCALAVNCFTGSFFYIDGNCVYKAGPVRQLAFSLLAAFNALGSGLTLLKLRRTSGAVRRRNEMVFVFGLTMMAAILLQLADPLLPVYALGCLFGCCLLHVFVVEDEHDEMNRKEMLAREYEAQLNAERAASKAKSYFFSTVSHDIRTPLNAIIGFSQMLKAGFKTQEEHDQAVDSILVSGNTLLRLVNDILDISKLESGHMKIEPEPTDCRRIIEEMAGSFSVSCRKAGLDLRTKVADMPILMIDAVRLRQIAFNLVGNALKFTKEGFIEVRASFSPDGDGADGGTFTLDVEDSGCGIGEEDLKLIATPYVQVGAKAARHGGTGLGLAITRELARAMGGELAVDSTLGKGSTFSVRIPDVRTGVMPERTVAGQVKGAAIAARRLLLVDDQEINLKVLKALLSKIGDFSLTFAHDGKEALRILGDDSVQPFDIVLTDMWMPEMDGSALAKAIRGNPRMASLPVYVATADVEVQKNYADLGFSGILLKPITLDKLQSLFA